MSIFQERLRLLKDKCGETQAKIASDLGITPQALSYYMNGREPNFDVLLKIARYFNTTTDYLLGLNNFKNEQQRNTLDANFLELQNQFYCLAPEYQEPVFTIYKNINKGYAVLAPDSKLQDEFLHRVWSLVGMMYMSAEIAHVALPLLLKGTQSNEDKEKVIQSILATIRESKAYCVIHIESYFDKILSPIAPNYKMDFSSLPSEISAALKEETRRMARLDINDPALSVADKEAILGWRKELNISENEIIDTKPNTKWYNKI